MAIESAVATISLPPSQARSPIGRVRTRFGRCPSTACALSSTCRRAGALRRRQVWRGVVRFSPRQSDLLMVMGTITDKMGRCSSESTSRCPIRNGCCAWGRVRDLGRILSRVSRDAGIDEIIPVDVYIPAVRQRQKRFCKPCDHPPRSSQASVRIDDILFFYELSG